MLFDVFTRLRRSIFHIFMEKQEKSLGKASSFFILRSVITLTKEVRFLTEVHTIQFAWQIVNKRGDGNGS